MGTVVRLAPDVELRRSPPLVLGGSPYRVLSLNPAAFEVLERWRAPSTLGASGPTRQLAQRLEDVGVVHVVAPAPGPAPTLTVVVPIRDRVDLLGPLLEALEGLEVLVVDDGSTDAAGIAACCERHGATVVRQETSRGPAAARNLGARQARGEVVAFVDSDVELDRAQLVQLAASFTDPRTAAVAPRVAPGSRGGVLGAYEQNAFPLDLGPTSAQVRPRTQVAYVPTATLLIRRHLACHFDEQLPYGEDVDLVWRLVEAGWVVRYVAEVVVHHPVRPNLTSLLLQRYRYGTSAAPLAQRHPAAAVAVAGSGWSALSWGAMLTGSPVVAGGLITTAIALLRRRLGQRVADPWRSAAAIAGGGTLRAGPSLANQVLRSYGPGLAAVAVMVPRLRRPLLWCALVAAVPRWWRQRGQLDLGRYLALWAADTAAYGTGVWAGSYRARTLGALRSSLSFWSSSYQAGPADADPA